MLIFFVGFLFFGVCRCEITLKCYDGHSCSGKLNITIHYDSGSCKDTYTQLDNSREILCTFNGYYKWRSYQEAGCASKHITIYSGKGKCLTKNDVPSEFSALIETGYCKISGCPNNKVITISVVVPVLVLLIYCIYCIFPGIFCCFCCPPFIVAVKGILKSEEFITNSEKQPLAPIIADQPHENDESSIIL